jgi:ectoine hydrolase
MEIFPGNSSILTLPSLLEIAPSNTNSIYKPSFSKEEIQSRVTKTRSKMKEQGIDLLIISAPDNLHYITGFDGWSFYVPQYAVLHVDTNSGDPYLFIRKMDSAAGQSTTYIKSSHILNYPDYFVDSDEYHPISLVCDLIKKKKWEHSIIGIDMDSDYCRARSVVELTDKLEDIKLVNDKRLINWVRSIKSENELNYIRQAAKIADLVLEAALKNIGVGSTQGDVAGKITKIQTKYGTYTAIAPMIMTNECAAHMNWTSEYKFQMGDITALELAGSFHHYHCPIARTCITEKPQNISLKLLETIQIVHRAMNSALCVAKSGNTAEDIYNAYNKVVKDTDSGSKKSRIGYSFGIGYPPDWGEKTLSCRPNDYTVLKPGMCIHLIAGCGDGFNYEYSEAIIIRDNGYPELLCETPRGLFIKETHEDPIIYLDFDLNLKLYNKIPTVINYSIPDFELKYIMGTRTTNNISLISNKLYQELTGDKSRQAFEFHHQLSTERTPLIELPKLSSLLKIKNLLIKDESNRRGLNSFKVLGVSYAINELIKKGELKIGDTVTTMTDGNHGLAIASVARTRELNAVIFVPKNTVKHRVNVIKNQGAKVVVVDGTYDYAVEFVKQQAKINNWFLIADHSWENYTNIPQNIMIGYTTIFQEAFYQASIKLQVITHIFIQVGVGGLAGACAAWCEKERIRRNNSKYPKLICVEPMDADCLLESAQNQCLSTCKGNTDSIMAGLNCGTPSLIAWPLLNDTVDVFMAIGDEWAKESMRVLKHSNPPDQPIIAGESGVGGLAGLLSLLLKDNDVSNNLKSLLCLDEKSVILCVNTEGATNPDLYKEIVKRKPGII